MANKAVLLSIRPKYAEKILNGSKTIELRRVIPKFIENDSLILMYSSSPVKAIVGAFTVETVIEESLSKLWPIVAKKACISRESFNSYFQGVNTGNAIFIKYVWVLTNPIKTNELEDSKKPFIPPQNFRYAIESDLQAFQNALIHNAI